MSRNTAKAATWTNAQGCLCRDFSNRRWRRAWTRHNRNRVSRAKADWYRDQQQARIFRSEAEANAAG